MRIIPVKSIALVAVLVLATGLAAVAPAPAGAAENTVFSPDTAVVGYAAGFGADVEARVTDLGGEIIGQHDRIGFMVVRVADPAAFVAEMAGAEGVRYAERDPLIFPEYEPNDMRYDQQWGPPAINAPAAWDVTKGAGAVVAVLDTGVQFDHPDLLLNTHFNLDEIPANGLDDDGNGFVDDVHGWDFNSNDNDPRPTGCGDHGTHVAGIVAATQDNLLGTTGIAPGATVMPMRVLCGGGHLSAAALAVAYAAENGADVVSCSWRAGYTLTAFEEAVTDAYENHDVLFVKSAGNQYGGGVTYPGRLPEFMAVSALDASLGLASYSSVGPEVEIAAPGSAILSTIGGAGYSAYSGTSMAAPHVAATAALVWSVNPDLTNEEVRAILTGTAVDAGAPGQDPRFGAGILDAAAAVVAAS